MNYFILSNIEDIGNGYLLLSLHHLYGSGPAVKLPVSGKAENYTIGKQIEVQCTMCK